MTRFEHTVDACFAAFSLSVAVAVAAFTLDAVQAHRAWPYEHACHLAHLEPSRQPLSATVVCLPTPEPR